jgi:hypothetical protein
MAHLTRLLAVAAPALALAAPATAALPPQGIQLDVWARVEHTTLWEKTEEGFPDECRAWDVTNGRQVLEIENRKPDRLLLSAFAGKPVLSTFDPGRVATYDVQVRRRVEREANIVQGVQPCVPCGPTSEYGECDPDPPKDPVHRIDCSVRKAPAGSVAISYGRGGGAVPDIRTGMVAKGWFDNTGTFAKACVDPPTMWSGEHTMRPPEVKLPKDEMRKVPELRVGQQLLVRVRDSAGWASPTTYDDRVHRPVRKDDCDALPKVTDGTTVCTFTTYAVEIKRVR